MKHAYLLALALLLVLPGRGQNFCPFRPGRLLEYTRAGNDTTVAVQLDRTGVTLATGDSAYALNTQLVDVRRLACPNCSKNNGGGNRLVGWLGLRNPQTMRATYALNSRVPYTAGGTTFYAQVSIPLNPKAPVGQPWTTSAGTAQVTARRLGLVLGQPDSLAIIELNDGVRRLTLSLSKTFGLVRTFTLAEILNYARQNTAPVPHTLSALSQLGLGTATMGARAVYDFQVGDVFLYRYAANDPMGQTPFSRIEYYFGDSVLARTTSTTSSSSDAVTYRMYSRSWHTGSLAVSTYNITYSSATSLPYSRPTGGVFLDRSSGRRLQFLPAVSGGQPGQRAVQRLVEFSRCGADSSCMAPTFIDVGYNISFGVGLGMVSENIYNGYPNSSSTTLVAYRKGTERGGNLAPWYRRALPARATRPAATTAAFPQPFEANLTVRFDLARPQPVAVALRDGLGRIVFARPPAPLPAGPQQLDLDTQRLPAGLYTLHLEFGGEGRTEVLKVLKN